MRRPVCIKCQQIVRDGEITMRVLDNDKTVVIHRRCEPAPTPVAPASTERDIRKRKSEGNGAPAAIRVYEVERDGRTFTVTVLPEVAPDPNRSQTTHFTLYPGDTGSHNKPEIAFKKRGNA